MHPAAQRIIHLYERHAQAWDRDRGRSLFEQRWLDRFFEALPSQSVLDLGCGAGEPMAHYLAQQGCAVTGVDTSPTLIALSQARFPGQEWIAADMRGLALKRRFGGILAWDSFFHLGHDDQRRMFATFGEHAAPGAALMFTSGPSHGEAIGSFEGEVLYHASLDASEYRALLNQHGFDVIAHVAEDRTCGGHTVWLTKHRA